MANITIGTSENFEIILNGDKPVFVDFFATWCGPCRMVSPLIDQLSEEYGDRISFVKVDVDDEPGIAHRFNVLSIPNLILIQDGEIVDQHLGAWPKNLIEEMLKQVL